MDASRLIGVALLLAALGCGTDSPQATPTGETGPSGQGAAEQVADDDDDGSVATTGVPAEAPRADPQSATPGGVAAKTEATPAVGDVSAQPETAPPQIDDRVQGWLAALVASDLAQRAEAAEALETLYQQQPATLVAGLRAQAPSVRRGAAFFFLDRFQADDTDVIQAYTEQLSDEDPEVRKIALVAAKRFPPQALKSASPKIVAVLRQGAAETNRASAARLLADLTDPDDDLLATVAQAAREDEATSVRTACVQTISKLATPQQASEVLQDALAKDADAKVRGLAAVRLGKLGPTGATALAAALDDADEDVRVKAARSLGSLGAAAVEPLVDQLKHADPQVRLLAVSALGSLGMSAKPAVDALKPLLQDPDPTVQQAAQRVLARLQPR